MVARNTLLEQLNERTLAYTFERMTRITPVLEMTYILTFF